MQIIMELYQLKNICAEMAELGVAHYIKNLKPATDLISQREAYRLFNETRVKKWVQRKFITEIRRAGPSIRSKKLYSYSELLTAHKAEKLDNIFRPLPFEKSNHQKQ